MQTDDITSLCLQVAKLKFDRFQTIMQQLPKAHNNMQQGVQTDRTCNVQRCCVHLHVALGYNDNNNNYNNKTLLRRK